MRKIVYHASTSKPDIGMLRGVSHAVLLCCILHFHYDLINNLCVVYCSLCMVTYICY